MRQLPVPDPGTPDIRSPNRFVMWLMAQQRASVLLGIVWGCAWMIAQALVPAAIGAAIDALAGHRTAAFTEDCLAVLGLGVLTAVTGVLRHRRVVANFLDAAYRIIQLITEHTTRLGNTLAKLLSTGEVVSVGTADVDAVGGAIDVSGRGGGAVASVIVVAVILLSRSLPLGLIVLIGGPLLTMAVGALLRPLHTRQQKYRDLQGQLATRAADIVAGLRVLRGIGGEPAFSARYPSQSQDLRHTGVHVARAESFLAGAEILLPGLFVTAATWFAAHYALHKMITPGQLVTFYAYTSFLAVPLATITEAADKIVRGHVAAGRVIAILRLRPEVTDPARPAPEPPPGAALADPESGLTVSAGELIGVAADDPAQAAALADRIGGYVSEPGPRLGGVHLRRPARRAARRGRSGLVHAGGHDRRAHRGVGARCARRGGARRPARCPRPHAVRRPGSAGQARKGAARRRGNPGARRADERRRRPYRGRDRGQAKDRARRPHDGRDQQQPAAARSGRPGRLPARWPDRRAWHSP